jgi:hypothetical protein
VTYEVVFWLRGLLDVFEGLCFWQGGGWWWPWFTDEKLGKKGGG